MTAFTDHGAAFSPDGKWIVYVSDELGQKEVYSVPLQVREAGSRFLPMVAPMHPGRRVGLFYKQGVSDDGRADPDTAESRYQSSRNTLQWLVRGRRRRPLAFYYVTPDGQRCVMIKEGGKSGETRQEMVFVINWFEELKRLVPTE